MPETETMPLPPATPSLDKISAHSDELLAISEFIEWAGARDETLRLCRWANAGTRFEEWVAVADSTVTRLAYRWLDLDPEVIETERQALLDYSRALTEWSTT